jgi:replicative DNA helicase
LRIDNGIHNIGSALIAALLKYPNKFSEFILYGIKGYLFDYNNSHKEIFEAAYHIFTSGGIPDVYTIKASTNSDITLNEIERLSKADISEHNIQTLCELFTNELTLVRLNRFAITVASETETSQDSATTLANAEKQFLEIGISHDPSGLKEIKHITGDTLTNIALRKANKQTDGIFTGISSVDQFIPTGFRPKQMIILAGRSSHGKTQLSLQMALYNAKVLGKRSAIFSLEMSKEELLERLLSCESQIPLTDILTGNITDWEKLETASNNLSKLPIHIADGEYNSIMDILSSVRRLKLIHPDLSMIIVDYLQLIDPVVDGTRNDQVAFISRSLKRLSSIGIVILALSQVNRKFTERAKEERRIQLSDLRDSGTIENDAHTVLTIYRPYLDTKDPDDRDMCDIEIIKQRNGPLGKISVWNNVRTQTIQDLDNFTR